MDSTNSALITCPLRIVTVFLHLIRIPSNVSLTNTFLLYRLNSPMKKVKSPAKVLQFRSPRKRLQMDLVDGVGGTPRGPSSPAKRFRVSLHGLDERASDPVAQLHSLNKVRKMSNTY